MIIAYRNAYVRAADADAQSENRIMIAPENHTLTVKLGHWFEARASGWGVLAIPALAAGILAAAAAHLLPI
jgi:hypothetical protein